MVNSFAQHNKHNAKPIYDTVHALGKGKHMIFTTQMQLELKEGKILQVTGNGTNKREAEEDAALKMIGSEEILAWRSGRVVLGDRERKVVQYFKKQDPVMALTQQRDKRRINDLEYDYVQNDDNTGFVCTVNFTDNEGAKHRFTGSGRAKRDARVQASLIALCSDLLIEHVEQSIK
jgi:dsRNA-specific ribonuclease